MQIKRGLGKGIEALIPPNLINTEITEEPNGFHLISTDSIIPNRQQPRTVFDEEKIRELADSIREQGIIQPLIVSSISDDKYELIAGERRLRAARMLGLVMVPAVIKQVDEEGMLALSIIENIQREDLNPIEEARAYQELINQFGYTQEDVAKKVGKSRVAVTNGIRLLNLPQVVQEDVASGRYSAGHARALLTVDGIHAQLKLRERILRDVPTVRDVEKIVQSYVSGGIKRSRTRKTLSPQMNELSDNLKLALETKVQIMPRGNGGKIVIEYYSQEDLDRVYGKIVKM
ncbi:MAG: ParB/RepB/Spo0J family partition protein [Pseudomonadota bacterium]